VASYSRNVEGLCALVQPCNSISYHQRQGCPGDDLIRGKGTPAPFVIESRKRSVSTLVTRPASYPRRAPRLALARPRALSDAAPQGFHQINDVAAGGALSLFRDDLVPLSFHATRG